MICLIEWKMLWVSWSAFPIDVLAHFSWTDQEQTPDDAQPDYVDTFRGITFDDWLSLALRVSSTSADVLLILFIGDQSMVELSQLTTNSQKPTR